MDYEYMTAPCGQDCFNCPAYLANKNPEMRTMVSEKIGIPSEKAACPGFRAVKGDCPLLPVLGVECHIYPCAEKKGNKLCCDCLDFPCDYLHPYADKADKVSHNIKVFNLCLIKKMGLESWAKDKAKSVKDVYKTGKLKM